MEAAAVVGSQVRPAPRWRWFVGFAVCGALWCLTLLGALTIGIFVFPVALVLTGWLSWRAGRAGPASDGGGEGALVGVSLPLLYVAWLNRRGPGTVCTTTATSQRCGDQWSPWPFLLIGVALATVAIVRFTRLRRRRSSAA